MDNDKKPNLNDIINELKEYGYPEYLLCSILRLRHSYEKMENENSFRDIVLANILNSQSSSEDMRSEFNGMINKTIEIIDELSSSFKQFKYSLEKFFNENNAN